jgi:L-seryl-tRNA(Ser) seleniumtransferase
MLLADPRLAEAEHRLGRGVVKAAVATAQRRVRDGEIPPAMIIDAAVAALPPTTAALQAVINATGVLVHTNLGRAPLSEAAQTALLAASGTVDVELDLTSGTRARRGRSAIDALCAAVTPAEAAHVVNNGAAALALAATALAADKEIVVSRGELVEIGDGFRLPDLLISTGARLREVGTTNRTELADYEAAIGPQTAFVLKVHSSNFRITGFTRSAGVAELASLGVPVVADIGSGLLTHEPALPDEPDASSTLRAGASLATASGDKLLGGPQSGLILGRAGLVRQLARHPLARALRVDKLTLAALEATIRGPAPPVSVALHADSHRLEERALRLADELRRVGIDAQPLETEAVVGGGGAPGVTLPSAGVCLPQAYAVALRTGDPAVLGRTQGRRCVLDLRAVHENDDAALARAVRRAATGLSADGRSGIPCGAPAYAARGE